MKTHKLYLPIILMGGLIALSGLPGCTAVDQNIALRYAPVDRPYGQHSGEIVISRVDPLAPARNSKGEWIIGSINNVHGIHQADLLSDRSLGEWISEALLLELKHAGYTVINAPALPPGAARGFIISEGYGKLKQDAFRVAHMADCTVPELKECLGVMSEELRKL